MIQFTKRFLVLSVALLLLGTLPPTATGQQTLNDVKAERGLNDDDVLAAVKTFMPRGGRDEYFAFVGTGNSGTMLVYGIPSMRIYKYVGVFSPEPWQGYGFDDESMLMLKKGSSDNRINTYGDMRYPALSETNGKYNGKYLFYSDGANSRIALLGLDDFETKQVLQHPLFINCYPGVAVTQNNEYVIQSSQYPAPWDNKSTNVEDFKSGVTFWSQYLELGPAILIPGGSHNFTMATGYANNFATIWVDLNDDLEFTPDEIVINNFEMAEAGWIYTQGKRMKQFHLPYLVLAIFSFNYL